MFKEKLFIFITTSLQNFGKFLTISFVTLFIITYINTYDKYELTTGHQRHSIAGNSDITIDGRHKIYINKLGAANNN